MKDVGKMVGKKRKKKGGGGRRKKGSENTSLAIKLPKAPAITKELSKQRKAVGVKG